MKAVYNLKGDGNKIPAGKSIDIAPIREFYNEHKDYSIDDVINHFKQTSMPDMDYSELDIYLKNNFIKKIEG